MYEDMKQTAEKLENAMAIKDWNRVSDEFASINQQLDKAKASKPAVECGEDTRQGRTPTFYIACMVKLAETVDATVADKEKVKKMSKNNNRELKDLRRKIQKNNAKYEREIAEFKETRVEEEDAGEDSESEGESNCGGGSSSTPEPMARGGLSNNLSELIEEDDDDTGEWATVQRPVEPKNIVMRRSAQEAFARQSSFLREVGEGRIGNVLLICDKPETARRSTAAMAAEHVVDNVLRAAPEHRFNVTTSTTFDDASIKLRELGAFNVVVFAHKQIDLTITDKEDEGQGDARGDDLRSSFCRIAGLVNEFQAGAFFIMWRDDILENAHARKQCFERGVHMIANDDWSISEAFCLVASHILDQSPQGEAFYCPLCPSQSKWPMSLKSLASHIPMYHGARSDPEPTECMVPGCSRRGRMDWEAGSFRVHVHWSHSSLPVPFPLQERGPLAGFVHVVCRTSGDKGKFLLVHEPAGLCQSDVTKLWLPAGRVDPGESFVEAAVRETKEEAGVDIRVIGVLDFVFNDHRRIDVYLLAQPLQEGISCKSVPDFESVGAMWIDVSDLRGLGWTEFRDPEPLEYIPLVDAGEKVGYSIDTPSFERLETLMRKWSKQKAGTRREHMDDTYSVWSELVDRYPMKIVHGVPCDPRTNEG